MYWRFVARRILLLVPVLLGVTILVFGLIHLSPGDPVAMILGNDYSPQAAAQVRQELGLDQPLWKQYGIWLERIVRGDMGYSLFSRDAVASLILNKLPVTIELALSAMFVACLIGIPLGIVAATKPNTLWDHISRLGAMIGVSMPVFWWGLILIAAFAVKLRWLPAGGAPSQFGLRALVLPAIALGTGFAALIARTTRATLLEALGQDYVRTARAKGLHEPSVILGHGLRTAMIPIITVIGLQFGGLLSGAVLTETVFSLPGVGLLLINSIDRRDYPVIQGAVLVAAVGFVFVNLLTDLTYGFLDPRIRFRQ